jgi:hypothetical protein
MEMNNKNDKNKNNFDYEKGIEKSMREGKI